MVIYYIDVENEVVWGKRLDNKIFQVGIFFLVVLRVFLFRFEGVLVVEGFFI